MTLAVRFHQTGDPDVLQLEETIVGHPGQGELKVRVESIGLNRAKITFRRDLQQGTLKPTIAKTFPLADIVATHRHMESNQQFGKVVVTT